MGVFSTYPTLDGNAGAVPITPYSGSKFAYLLSGAPNVFTNLTAMIFVPSAGQKLITHVWFDTFEVPTSCDGAYSAVLTLSGPSHAPGASTTIFSISSSDVATGSDYYGNQHGGQTGWIAVQYTFTEAGYHALTYGVTNCNDAYYNSALAVDDIQVSIGQVTLICFGSIESGANCLTRESRRSLSIARTRNLTACRSAAR